MQHSSGVWSLAELQNGNIAGGNRDGVIRIWNKDTGSVIRDITGLAGNVKKLAVLKNGDLVSGDDGGNVNIWNANGGSLVRKLSGHNCNIFSLAELQNMKNWLAEI